MRARCKLSITKRAAHNILLAAEVTAHCRAYRLPKSAIYLKSWNAIFAGCASERSPEAHAQKVCKALVIIALVSLSKAASTHVLSRMVERPSNSIYEFAGTSYMSADISASFYTAPGTLKTPCARDVYF